MKERQLLTHQYITNRGITIFFLSGILLKDIATLHLIVDKEILLKENDNEIKTRFTGKRKVQTFIA
jgi:hypothetical protein